jgi:hypothetical protein
MSGHGEKFGRKKEEAIVALLTQRNIEEAAKAAGIGANTLLRWLKVPEFQAAYREAHRAAFGQAIARLQQGPSAAATTLLRRWSTRTRRRPSKYGRQRQSLITQPRRSKSKISRRVCRNWSGLLKPRIRGIPGIGDRMRAALRSRLERLEVRVAPKKPHFLPYSEWCDFEERPGPAPLNSVDGSLRIYLAEDDMAL